MSTAHSVTRTSLRTIMEGGVCLILVLLFTQTWFIDGLPAPCRVTGGSMAVSLLGVHRDVVCSDCGFAFACDAAAPPVSPRAVCPNCGYAENSVEPLLDLQGDRLLIDRSAFHFRRPRRWEIVAFRHSQKPGKILVKRVVGLPGESVRIQNGDVYIDGQIQRKNLDRQRSMAVPVFDAKYSPNIEPTPPPRWQGENENSLWNSAAAQFIHSNTSESHAQLPHPNPLPEAVETIDWLVYHHWRRMPGRRDEVMECPITDIMAYNQNLPRREEDVHAMIDLMLCFRLARTVGQGKFFIRAIAGKDVYQVEINPNAGLYRATRNRVEILLNDNQLPPKIKDLAVVVSLIDRQFLLALNDRTVICLPMDDPLQPMESTSQPFALGTEGLGIVLDEVKIYRDIYYTHPIGFNGDLVPETTAPLGCDEYFVLGDNSPVAEDSRTWHGRYPVLEKSLIGRPFMIFFPAKSVRLGDWQFQVPDPRRIGYIL